MDERETFRLAKILDKNNIDQAEDIIDKAAAQHKLDKETYRLLKTFQDEFLMVSGISVAYIDHLKQHELVLKRMGSVFKSLGLARRVKGAEFAWKPKNMLREIIGERAGGPPDRDVKIDKWNEAIIKSCWKSRERCRLHPRHSLRAWAGRAVRRPLDTEHEDASDSGHSDREAGFEACT